MSNRFRARVGLRAKLAWLYRGTVLGVSLTLLGLASQLTSVPDLINWLAVLLGVGLSILEVHRLRTAARATIFQFRESDDFTALSTPEHSEPLTVTTGRDTGWLFRAESRWLRHEQVPVTQGDPFRLAPELERWSTAFLSRRFQESRMFNADAVGLASDPPLSLRGGPVELRPCSYYDFVTTNLLAQHDVYETGHRGVTKDGTEWFVDRSGRLRPLAGSWLANLVGVSTLAFTADGQLVLVQQTKHNTGSPGLFAPSGSGALEPQDVRDRTDLAAIVMAGADRELRQECAVAEHEIESSTVTGYSRWLSRGAMPEFAGVTLLSLTSHALRERPVERSERAYVIGRHFVRLTEFDTWDIDRPLDLLPRPYRASCSMPLALALAALIDTVQQDDTPLLAELRRRFSA